MAANTVPGPGQPKTLVGKAAFEVDGGLAQSRGRDSRRRGGTSHQIRSRFQYVGPTASG